MCLSLQLNRSNNLALAQMGTILIKTNLDGEMLPPNSGCFTTPHFPCQFCHYVEHSLRHKLSRASPQLKGMGWNLLESGCYIPVQCFVLPALKSVLVS